MKTSELTGAALDWAVTKAEGKTSSFSAFMKYPGTPKQEIVGWGVYLEPTERDEFGAVTYAPSTDWSQGGPIIERALISLGQNMDGDWFATKWIGRLIHERHVVKHPDRSKPLIAAMRCFVASKLGDEVEIPEELK